MCFGECKYWFLWWVHECVYVCGCAVCIIRAKSATVSFVLNELHFSLTRFNSFAKPLLLDGQLNDMFHLLIKRNENRSTNIMWLSFRRVYMLIMNYNCEKHQKEQFEEYKQWKLGIIFSLIDLASGGKNVSTAKMNKNWNKQKYY